MKKYFQNYGSLFIVLVVILSATSTLLCLAPSGLFFGGNNTPLPAANGNSYLASVEIFDEHHTPKMKCFGMVLCTQNQYTPNDVTRFLLANKTIRDIEHLREIISLLIESPPKDYNVYFRFEKDVVRSIEELSNALKLPNIVFIILTRMKFDGSDLQVSVKNIDNNGSTIRIVSFDTIKQLSAFVSWEKIWKWFYVSARYIINGKEYFYDHNTCTLVPLPPRSPAQPRIKRWIDRIRRAL